MSPAPIGRTHVGQTSTLRRVGVEADCAERNDLPETSEHSAARPHDGNQESAPRRAHTIKLGWST